MAPPSFGLSHWIRRPSMWLCLAALALAMIPVSQAGNTIYGPAAAAQATLAFFVVTPAIAAAAAWEASRFQAFVQQAAGPVRKIVLDRVLLFALFAPAGYALALLTQVLGMPTIPVGLVLGMLVYSLLVGVCWALIGGALGLVFRPIIAVTVAGLIAYAWYAITPSLRPGVLRRLTGDFVACCSLDTTLDPQALIAASIGIGGFTLAVIGAVLTLRAARAKHGLHTGLASSAAGITCLIAGVVMSTKMDTFGLTARDTDAIQCDAEVCTWPEIPPQTRQLNAEARTLFRNLAPEHWKPYADPPVQWGEFSLEHLSLSGQPSVEGVLGEFVDQAGLAALVRENATICGVPASEVGMVLSGQPWVQDAPIDPQQVNQRLEQALCKPQG